MCENIVDSINDNVHLRNCDQDFVNRKGQNLDAMVKEEGEDDDYASSLLSVHFGEGDAALCMEGKTVDGFGGELTEMNEGEGESSQESEAKIISEAQAIGNASPLFIATEIDLQSTTPKNKAWNNAITATDNGSKQISNSFIINVPKVSRRPRQRPLPKTSTMYNADLTAVVTADQICLNIRMKERKEKHERWKMCPQERTKYRTKSTRKTGSEAKRLKMKATHDEDFKMGQKEHDDTLEDEGDSGTGSNNNESEADSEFPHQCQYCGRSFLHLSRLKLHERCHTGEKPYPCPFCDKAFSQNGYLKTHLKIHTGEKPFCCSICDYSFPRSTTLKRHMRVHTGECPYTCHICSRSFNQKSSLSKHVKVHSDDRPHVCPVCNRGFKLIDTLRAHQKTHEEVRSFICSVCDKAFKTKPTLLSHMATHTRILTLQGGEDVR